MVLGIERFASETVLQDRLRITIKGKEYEIEAPTVATVIEAGKYISELPEEMYRMDENSREQLFEAMSVADKCGCFGRIAAIILLGKQNLYTERSKWLGWLFRGKKDNVTPLANRLNETLTPPEMAKLVVELLGLLNPGFFLSIGIFLKGVNMMKRTKTTASGRSSPG
jgi:hypothetical protein